MPRVHLKTEDFEVLKQYIEGDASAPSRELVSQFLQMSQALQMRMYDNILSLKHELETTKRKLSKYDEEERRKVETGEFDELGFDTKELAFALLYILKSKTHFVSMVKLQACLFLVYANWLAFHGQKICIENPVAQEKGPWFWSVAKKIDTRVNVSADWLNRIRIANPGVAAVISNVADKYGELSDSRISGYLTKTLPYKQADKEHNAGKWNGVIQDKLIYEWKKYEKNQ